MSREQKENAEIAELGRKIRRAREAGDISLADAAKRAGISTAFLNKVENGISCPSAVILARLATVIGEDINDLVSHVKTLEQRFDDAWAGLSKEEKKNLQVWGQHPFKPDFETKKVLLQVIENMQPKKK